jgi:hypothetical protein
MKNTKRLLASFFVGLVGLNAHAQGTQAEYMEELARSGFNVRMHSFFSTKQRLAFTVMEKVGVDRKEAHEYTAEIATTKTGAYVYFTAYRACIPTPFIQLTERIVSIEGQKMEAEYVCRTSAARRPQEIYIIKSVAGNEYVKKTFSEKALVLIHLNGVPVPFDMQGFSKVFTEASAKVL